MKKVMILEDEVSIRSFVVINLKRAGYEVVEAGTGEEALELLKANPDVGVAILDIMLPGIDGFEVCRSIRATQPEMIPPKIAHRNKSLPASGDTIVTSTGRISVMIHATME